jgi:hypothetical protein
VRVALTIVLDDEQRRRVRATMGRGGKATRAEVRIWMQRVLQVALKTAPEPRRRRSPAPKTAPLPLPGDVAEVEVTDETVCRHCGRPRERHGKMMLTCLPATGVPVGARFSPAA